MHACVYARVCMRACVCMRVCMRACVCACVSGCLVGLSPSPPASVPHQTPWGRSFWGTSERVLGQWLTLFQACFLAGVFTRRALSTEGFFLTPKSKVLQWLRGEWVSLVLILLSLLLSGGVWVWGADPSYCSRHFCLVLGLCWCFAFVCTWKDIFSDSLIVIIVYYVRLKIKCNLLRLLKTVSRILVSRSWRNIASVSFVILTSLYAGKNDKYINKSDLIWKILKQMNVNYLKIPEEWIVFLTRVLAGAYIYCIAIVIHKQHPLGDILSSLELELVSLQALNLHSLNTCSVSRTYHTRCWET